MACQCSMPGSMSVHHVNFLYEYGTPDRHIHTYRTFSAERTMCVQHTTSPYQHNSTSGQQYGTPSQQLRHISTKYQCRTHHVSTSTARLFPISAYSSRHMLNVQVNPFSLQYF